MSYFNKTLQMYLNVLNVLKFKLWIRNSTPGHNLINCGPYLNL